MKFLNLVYFLTNNPCEDPEILKVILYIKLLMKIAFIAIPIILIVLITFDFVKNVTAATEDVQKKNQKIVIKRLIYAVMLFFVIPIVNVVFSAFDNSGNKELYGWDGVNYLTCWTNADEDKTFIEKFEKTAKFEGNDGVVYGGKIKTCGGYDSCELKSLPRASKNGYTFKGWSSSSDCSGNPVTKITLVEKETVLYACYDKNEEESISNSSTTGINSIASDWWWPIQKNSNGEPKTKKVSSKFGPRNVAKSKYHYGIDISGGNSPEIIASYDGVIDTLVNSYTGTTKKPNYGNYIIIKHNINGTTYYSWYAHMAPKSIPSNLKVGDSISAGTVVGKMGQTGYSFGIHLHFEIRKNSKDSNSRGKNAIDPLKLIDPNNPYPSQKDSNNETLNTENNDSSNNNASSNSSNLSKNCNGRTVNITNKNGVTYVDNILVVNKTYSLPSNYNPEGLTNVNQLASVAKEAFNNMAAAIKKEKGVSIKIYSGFRSYNTQKSTYDYWVNQKGSKAAADRISARAGHSEHQTGLAVDINSVKNSFKNTTQGKWLNANAYKYGFILRYPENTEKQTGYQYEPWHYRYVGKDLAKKLYNNGNWITMEKYFCLNSYYRSDEGNYDKKLDVMEDKLS